MSRSHANPPMTQDQQDDVDSRQPGDVLEALHDASNEMDALHLVNQYLLRELAELTRQVQRPQGAQQAHEGRNTIPHEEQQHFSAPRDVDGGGENSRTRGHDPYIPTGDGHDGEVQGRTTKATIQSLTNLKRGHNLGNNVSKTPTRAQPHEGGCKWSSPNLHGSSSTADGIPVHDRGFCTSLSQQSSKCRRSKLSTE